MTVFSIAYGSCVVCGAPAEGMVNAAAFGNWSEPGRMEPRCRAHGAPPSMTLVSIEEYENLKAEVERLTAALQKIAEDNRIAHPERPEFWVVTNTAPGHRRCREIARDALKKVIPNAPHD